MSIDPFISSDEGRHGHVRQGNGGLLLTSSFFDPPHASARQQKPSAVAPTAKNMNFTIFFVELSDATREGAEILEIPCRRRLSTAASRSGTVVLVMLAGS